MKKIYDGSFLKKQLAADIFATQIHSDIFEKVLSKLFHDRGSYQIETSPLICSANQWTGFYMMGPYVIKAKEKQTEAMVFENEKNRLMFVSIM